MADLHETTLERAERCFTRGDYAEALRLYEQLGKRFGSRAFEADAAICRSRLYRQKPLMFTILDEMSYANWSHAYTCVPLSPDTWRNEMHSFDAPLLVEATWGGRGGREPDSLWWKKAEIKSCMAKFREAGRRVIFWNKEDPLNHKIFIDQAQCVDVILTTDENIIPVYKKVASHVEIGTLPFCVNPFMFNPAGRDLKSNGVIAFAGSNYVHGHNDRIIQLKMLLPLIIEYKGTIFNRMSRDTEFNFHSAYNDFLRDALPYSKMPEVYKKFRFFLNVNTVTDSPTMLARRVYELLACGTLVVSWPSEALKKQFPDLVLTATSAGRAIALMNPYLEDLEKWKRHGHSGYREVMNNHTIDTRKAVIDEFAGISSSFQRPKVSIVMATMRPKFIKRIADNIVKQTYNDLEALIVTQGYTCAQREELATLLRARPGLSVKIMADDGETPLGARMNRLIRLACGQYVAKFDDDDFYFPKYIADSILPFRYTKADITGKYESFTYLDMADETYKFGDGHSHQYMNFVLGPTIVAKKSVFDHIGFANKNRGEDSAFLRDAVDKGIKIYARDQFNFSIYRSYEAEDHTYKISGEDIRLTYKYLGKGFRTDLIEV